MSDNQILRVWTAGGKGTARSFWLIVATVKMMNYHRYRHPNRSIGKAGDDTRSTIAKSRKIATKIDMTVTTTRVIYPRRNDASITVKDDTTALTVPMAGDMTRNRENDHPLLVVANDDPSTTVIVKKTMTTTCDDDDDWVYQLHTTATCHWRAHSNSKIHADDKTNQNQKIWIHFHSLLFTVRPTR